MVRGRAIEDWIEGHELLAGAVEVRTELLNEGGVVRAVARLDVEIDTVKDSITEGPGRAAKIAMFSIVTRVSKL